MDEQQPKPESEWSKMARWGCMYVLLTPVAVLFTLWVLAMLNQLPDVQMMRH